MGVIFPTNEDMILDGARQAAIAGYVRPEAIPLLAITDESFYHRKLTWTILCAKVDLHCHVSAGTTQR